MDKLERLDRRAFLFGMAVTSAGVLVPKPAQIFVPPSPMVFAEYDQYLDMVIVKNARNALEVGVAIHQYLERWMQRHGEKIPPGFAFDNSNTCSPTEMFVGAQAVVDQKDYRGLIPIRRIRG